MLYLETKLCLKNEIVKNNRGNLGRNQAPKLHNLPTRPKKIIKEKYKIKLSRRKGSVTTGVDSHKTAYISTQILIPLCTY